MWGICVKQAKGTNGDFFLEVGKKYEILSIQEFRESQITEILNDTSLEM